MIGAHRFSNQSFKAASFNSSISQGGDHVPTFLHYLFAGRHVRPVTMYHILHGKRTFSNLYAAFINDLLPFWGLLPHLSRPRYEKMIDYLVHQKLLTEAPDETLTAPPAALPAWWPTHVAGLTMPAYREIGDILTLAVQLISQVQHQERHFAPITPHLLIQQRVKGWYERAAKTDLPGTIAEFKSLVTAMPELAGTVLVNRLVGAETDVASWQDLAAHLGFEPFQVQLVWIDALAQLYQAITGGQAARWQGLLPLPTPAVTRSAQATMQLLADQSVDQTAQQRQLAASTIREHILEAAMLGPAVIHEQPGWRLPPAKADPVVDFFRGRLAAIARQRQSGGVRLE
jgi:uncharacterized protein YpbB